MTNIPEHVQRRWLWITIICLVVMLYGIAANAQTGRIIQANNRYFQFQDGTSYIPIGVNYYRLFFKTNGEITTLMQDYAAHGINYIRIFVDFRGDVETPLGTYDSARLATLDHIVAEAEANGIYLAINLWDENAVKNNGYWTGFNPYNVAVDPAGTATVETDMYDIADTDTFDAMKARYAFLVNRWKTSTHVFMFDLANESEKTQAWADAMETHVRLQDEEAILLTYQENTDQSSLGWFDAASVRVYFHSPSGNDPELMYNTLKTRVDAELPFGNPVYVGEFGMDKDEVGAATKNERGFMHMLWGPSAICVAGNSHSWLAPGGGSALTYPELTAQELDWMKNFADWSANVDWPNFDSSRADNEVTSSNADVVTTACRDNDEMLLYLMNDDPADTFNATTSSITVGTGLTPQAYKVEFIDVRTGSVVQTDTVSTVPFVVTTPSFNDGLFVHITRTAASALLDLRIETVMVQASGTTGTQDIIGNLGGRTPTGAMVVVQYDRDLGSARDFATASVGFTCGMEQYVSYFGDTDNEAAADGLRGDSINHIISYYGGTANTVTDLNNQASFVSWLPDGMRINWESSSGFTSYMLVTFYSGQSVSGCKTGNAQLSATVGNPTEVDTIGFEPNFILTATADRTSLNGSGSIGIQNGWGVAVRNQGISQYHIAYGSKDNVNPTEVASVINTGSAIGAIRGAGSEVFTATLGSFDDQGFTVTGTAPNRTFGYMALQFEPLMVPIVKILDSPTAVGNQSYPVLGFDPESVYFMMTALPDVGVIDSTGPGGVGWGFANNGGSQGSVGIIVPDNLTPTNTKSRAFADAMHIMPDGVVNIVEATLGSFDANGFTLNATVADPTPRKFIAIGYPDAANPPTQSTSRRRVSPHIGR